MTIFDQIRTLTRQLYPTGRAFRGPMGRWLDRLHKGLAISEQVAYTDAVKIQDSMLPDNAGFSTADATDWERRLGMISNPAVPLADRMLAIARKMNHPGNIPARQHYLYLQGQLQRAGFNVYVYENRFPDGMGGYTTQNPLTITGGLGAFNVQHGDIQHGDAQHGGTYGNIVVSYISETQDRQFNVGNNLRSTFFIGGATLGSFAYVSLARKAEFRQLILKIKPVQTVGYLFVLYV